VQKHANLLNYIFIIFCFPFLRSFQQLMKQKQYQPLTIAEMAVSLYAANEGYLDNVDVKKVVDFEHALHSYMRANHAELLASVGWVEAKRKPTIS